MATAELRQPIEPGNSTPIQYLHELWERANAVYNAVEEASPVREGPDARVKASWFDDATMQVYRQAYHLQLALLNEQPVTMTDAAILAGHLQSHGCNIDGTAEKYREEAFEALERGQASLFGFLANQAGLQLSGWLAGTLAGARREIALRTGRPDDWDKNKAA